MIPKKLRPFIILPVLLTLLVVSVVLLVNFLIQKPSVQHYLIKKLSNETGYQIRTGRIELNLWKGIGIHIDEFEMGLTKGAKNLEAEGVRITFDQKKLLRGEILPTNIYLIKPEFELALPDEPLGERPWQQVKGLPLFWFPGLRSLTLEKAHIRISNRPFEIKRLKTTITRTSENPLTLTALSKGRLSIDDKEIPFRLKGILLHPPDQPPTIDVSLETGYVPVNWIPWPKSLPFQDGKMKTWLNIDGDFTAPLSVVGKLRGEGILFSVLDEGRKKDYALPSLVMDFRSSVERGKIVVPSLKLQVPDLTMSVNFDLDLDNPADPLLQLNATSPFMNIRTFEKYFPTPLVSPWLKQRLFPLLKAGDVQVLALRMNGRIDQIDHLSTPGNQQAFFFKTACKNFVVYGEGIQHPFQEITAQVAYEEGNVLVSNLNARFEGSVIEKGSLEIHDIFQDRPPIDFTVDGDFDLRSLVDQKEMVEFVPPDILRKLDQMEKISGRMSCRADFRYYEGWEFPITRKGIFRFKNCRVEQEDLLFPLFLTRAEIRIEEKNENEFRGAGTWGRSTFSAIGAFGQGKKVFPLQWTNISAKVDMNEVVPLLYRGTKFPLSFSGPVAAQISMKREIDDHWTGQGKVDLEGIVLENENVSMDPPGAQDSIFIDLAFWPGDRVHIKKLQCDLRGSSLVLSGSYDLKEKDFFTIDLSVPGLFLEDLGIRFKERATLTKGTLKGKMKIMTSRTDPLKMLVIGKMAGSDLSFHLNRLPAPVSDCNFLLDFSGRDLSIDAWNMRVGDSPLKIKGTLKGWDELKGDVFVHSEYLKMADLKPIRRDGPTGEKKSDIEKILDNLDIYIKLVALRGRWKEFDWGPMRADMDLTNGDLYIKSLRTRLDHGTFNTSGHIKRNGKKEIYFSSHIWLSEQPIRDLFEGFSLESDYINGKMDLEAFLIMVGKEKKDLIPSLSGTANMLIKKGTIKKTNAFIKILDFLSLRKIFKRKPSNLPKDGFYFEQITGYAVIDDGVLKSENFLMKSPVYNAVATGRVDLSKREIQATLGVQPLETIDTLLSKIPILGYALTGEDQSFLTYYFMVRGPMKSPDVDYVPFKNLGSGVGNVLKRLFLTPFRLYEDLSNMPKISSDSPGGVNPVAERGRFPEEKE